MRALALFLCAVSVLLFVGAAAADRARPSRSPGSRAAGAASARRVRVPRPPPRARSIGFPWDGRIERAAHLVESNHVRYLPEYRPGQNFYGTSELVALLERAARVVTRRMPGIKLSVGEISRRAGGEIDGHGSHESGRDVDVGFYMKDSAGRPYAPNSFAGFDRDGHGIGVNRGLRFDDARNWELVSRLVTDGEARVQYIFVESGLRTRLLAEGRRRRATPAVLDRAALVLVQPAVGHPHRNHFHVRIYCDPRDRPRCGDRTPFWPWYPGTPPGPTLPASLGGVP